MTGRIRGANRWIRILTGLFLFNTALLQAGTHTVINTDDSGPGSLRQTIIDATPGDTIDFAPALAGQTILLSSTLDLNKDIVIQGPGPNISGNNAVRAFFIQTGNVVSLFQLTIENAYSDNENGGAIYNAGSELNIRRCTFRGNSAFYNGGAIFNTGDGSLTVRESGFFSNRSVFSSGGAIYNHFSRVLLQNSVFQGDGNSFVIIGNEGRGRSFQPRGETMIVQNCTINDSSMKTITGIYNYPNASLTVQNCTLNISSTQSGICILNAGSLRLENTILTGNAGSSSSANYLDDRDSSVYTVVIFSHNLIGSQLIIGRPIDIDYGGNLPGVDPLLGPLQDNGGTTPTQALLVGSPAINAGNNGGQLPTDQRGAGFERIVDQKVDMGAFEVQPPAPPATATSFELTVTSGNPIRVNDWFSSALIQTIYRESFDELCNGTLSGYDIASYPFSGAAGHEVVLRARFSNCGSEPAFSSAVNVAWRIQGTSLAGIEQWTGPEGYIHVAVPDVIGSYTVEFEFSIDQGVLWTLARRLLVTKGPALPYDDVVGVRRLSWYERAVEWASGISVNATDGEFMSALLDGLYDYGSTHWRYRRPGFTVGCSYSDYPFPTYQKLLADPSVALCNEGICYDFSAVLETVAATLGIGGLVDHPVDRRRFLTVKSPSLDPIFPGNVYDKSTDGIYDRYEFADHSLVRLGDRYFDATFGNIYSSDEEFIAYTTDGGTAVDEFGDIYYTTVEGARFYSPFPVDWYLTDWATRHPELLTWGSSAYVEPRDSQASRFSGFHPFTASSAPSLTGQISWRLIDADGDGLADQLAADVEVELPEPGALALSGELERDGVLVANSPAFKTQTLTTALIDGVAGVNTVTLQFSGEQILRSGLNGPYDLNLVLKSAGPWNHDTAVLSTPAFDRTQFGEVGASVVSVTEFAQDIDGDGRFDQIPVTVGLAVRREGHYTVEGNLTKDGKTLVSAALGRTLFIGAETVRLVFSGQQLRRDGLSGPFTGVIALRDSAGESLDSIGFTTAAYDVIGFAPFSEATAPWVEEAIDSNGNNLFDFLRIAQPISIAEAGDYILSARLSGPTSTKSAYADTRAILVKGANTVAWTFAGPLVFAQQLDGPYHVDIVVREAATGIERDRLRLPQLTKPYLHTEFDSFEKAPARGDLDGDGDIDHEDLAVIRAARGSLAEGPDDRRDLDGDGKITVLDMRKLVLLFTHPGGAK
jgi:predicted outer membrane repeat protein